ncbi:hypothetical protein COW36_01455 [bacterium (Candidatus Blackallbacteria) CG17_big_fil_post_rev_8_21_14_2_50_48_46]|uniref:protein O-GlcNAc transferase n=1 Tax=bacterium (Candidatus Blackallbacteria) CG17_big_fil_post_rev_8_21_14_2_50_48_46 TaxID=2014261 RepID=A0A2M7GC66_9BACT|nr:MAG: hypothetical protein COW64_09720 [bacterium (Candidatus Blackallbacteria) CG18_big_fil_WC_8_21_14_2_50_49_26]PIW19533.1 MAG: hypothetical protein COW36_01455 [bacterium (Candidatus Blackallbacteria) CG17_big_fil_post_rev_8_21_14_2_50_48_46]PIW48864.1 MAG: hypothetical protein COW20_07000 [bacterium (Candidatus Blackallbacteria) CG13_big_fil_rev_8_21_14_2_50_49_14]
MHMSTNHNEVFHLAINAHRQGALNRAYQLYHMLLEQNIQNADLFHLFGSLLLQLNQLPQAIARIEQAIVLNPGRPDFFNSLGLAYQTHGDLEPAQKAFEQAIRLEPDYFAGLVNLGNFYFLTKQNEKALSIYQQALSLSPDHVQLNYQIALLLRQMEHYHAADQVLRKLVLLAPGFTEAWFKLALNTLARAKPEEALAFFEKTLAQNADSPEYIREYMICLQAIADLDVQEKTKAMAYWQTLVEKRAKGSPPDFSTHDRQAKRKLKIGYISSNFCAHSSSSMMKPLFQHFSADQFEITAYSSVKTPDELTRFYQGRADHWREIQGLSDSAIAHLIQADTLDILVDLNGPTANNHFMSFIDKPAPIQVTGLAFGSTSGIPAMDYCFTDQYLAPQDSQKIYTEKIHYLPIAFNWSPPDFEAEPAPAPFEKNHWLTFGSGNKLFKHNQKVIQVWAEILKQVPHSRLALKTGGLDEIATQQEIRAQFQALGIETERIQLQGNTDHDQHLAFYKSLDIALDPFPYDGGVTTCETLWMGVPVIVFAAPNGQRGGVTILRQMGLSQCLAHSYAEYIDLAVHYASHPQELLTLRKGLRTQLLNSPVCDQKKFLASIETAYQSFWKTWLETKHQNSASAFH